MVFSRFKCVCSCIPYLLLLFPLFAFQPVQAQTTPSRPDSISIETVRIQEQSNRLTEQVKHPDTLTVDSQKRRLSPVAKGAVVVIAGAGIWTATFALVDEPVQQFTQRNRSDVADNIAYALEPLGRQGFIMPLAGAAFAGGLLAKDAKLQKVGLVSMGSILISSGITSSLKYQFSRCRPSITTENHIFLGPSRTSDYNSLPSSHTAIAFAVATSVATVYGYDYKYVPPIAYGVATLVGLSRINDNAHWATDVMAGALVGYLTAKGTLYLYDMADQKLKNRRQRLLLSPQLGLHTGGVTAILVF